MFESLLARLLSCCNYVRQINKLINDDDDGNEPVLSSQTIDADNPDLTTILPSGAASVKVGAKAGSWRAFTGISYQGTPVPLEAGRSYPTPESMGLNSPVMSIRKV